LLGFTLLEMTNVLQTSLCCFQSLVLVVLAIPKRISIGVETYLAILRAVANVFRVTASLNTVHSFVAEGADRG
jgi:hypothetical protein